MAKAQSSFCALNCTQEMSLGGKYVTENYAESYFYRDWNDIRIMANCNIEFSRALYLTKRFATVEPKSEPRFSCFFEKYSVRMGKIGSRIDEKHLL